MLNMARRRLFFMAMARMIESSIRPVNMIADGSAARQKKKTDSGNFPLTLSARRPLSHGCETYRCGVPPKAR
jgi:hypothetical protein